MKRLEGSTNLQLFIVTPRQSSNSRHFQLYSHWNSSLPVKRWELNNKLIYQFLTYQWLRFKSLVWILYARQFQTKVHLARWHYTTGFSTVNLETNTRFSFGKFISTRSAGSSGTFAISNKIRKRILSQSLPRDIASNFLDKYTLRVNAFATEEDTDSLS